MGRKLSRGRRRRSGGDGEKTFERIGSCYNYRKQEFIEEMKCDLF